MSAAKPTLEIGDELEERALPPVMWLQLIEYAGASGDYNPLHTIDEAAYAAGLKGIIIHGMLTLATMSLLFSPYLEHGFIKEVCARFFAMVYVGDELTVGSRITGAEKTEEGYLYP